MWSMTHGYKEGLEIDRIDVNGVQKNMKIIQYMVKVKIYK